MRFYSILGTVLGARDAEVTGTHLGACGLLVSVSLKSWPSARCSGRSGTQLRGRHSHYSWWKLSPLQVGAWRAWCCPCEWPGGMCQLEQGTGAWVGDGEESLPTLQGREASWRVSGAWLLPELYRLWFPLLFSWEVGLSFEELQLCVSTCRTESVFRFLFLHSLPNCILV